DVWVKLNITYHYVKAEYSTVIPATEFAFSITKSQFYLHQNDTFDLELDNDTDVNKDVILTFDHATAVFKDTTNSVVSGATVITVPKEGTDDDGDHVYVTFTVDGTADVVVTIVYPTVNFTELKENNGIQVSYKVNGAETGVDSFEGLIGDFETVEMTVQNTSTTTTKETTITVAGLDNDSTGDVFPSDGKVKLAAEASKTFVFTKAEDATSAAITPAASVNYYTVTLNQPPKTGGVDDPVAIVYSYTQGGDKITGSSVEVKSGTTIYISAPDISKRTIDICTKAGTSPETKVKTLASTDKKCSVQINSALSINPHASVSTEFSDNAQNIIYSPCSPASRLLQLQRPCQRFQRHRQYSIHNHQRAAGPDWHSARRSDGTPGR
ncbi:MAG: hypothetical protein Q4G10_05985, partial [Bacteroidia bacterium]|nr:hypothetical protein [Bacteroidia bacterium]